MFFALGNETARLQIHAGLHAWSFVPSFLLSIGETSLASALLASTESHVPVTSQTEREWHRNWYDLPRPFEQHGQAALKSIRYASLCVIALLEDEVDIARDGSSRAAAAILLSMPLKTNA